MRLQIILLFIITLLGGVLRFYQLGQTPQSLTWDEVAIGYNAYSILRTGRDEYGNFLPTSFRSFEDYKSPLYIYGTTLSLAIFGKSEFAIRFLSALTGTLTIPLLALWVVKIIGKNNFSLALLTSLLCATSPWHLHFSRVAYESNLALFFCATILNFASALVSTIRQSSVAAPPQYYLRRSRYVFVRQHSPFPTTYHHCNRNDLLAY
ncbi:MAG: hypothetical protein KatS3mg087_1455 [Patescibacteria group bacterium]|nr:MAG: hypothetical protein KatS3mg087_1455 [Patescibacteria group bacterium]